MSDNSYRRDFFHDILSLQEEVPYNQAIFYENMKPIMRNMLSRKGIQCIEDREEIIQDAIHDIMRNAHKYDKNKGRASTWIMRILLNRMLTFLTRQKRRLPLENIDHTTHLPPASHKKRCHTAEQLYSYFCEETSNAFAYLSYKYQTFFIMQAMGYSIREIGERFSLSLSNSHTNWSKAKERLLALMNDKLLIRQRPLY